MDIMPPNRESFTPAAVKAWDRLAAAAQARILSTVWCGACRKATHIQVRSARVERGDLLLSGVCGQCGGSVARVVEGE